MISPKMRRKARMRALEYLFGLEFTGYAWDESLEDFWEKHPSKPQVRDYAEILIGGVGERRDDLDARIVGALTTWSWDRIDRVERSVLRIALFEMAFREDVPPTVAINEAIELTKMYGGDESPRFVNGVLDRLKDATLAQG